MAVFTSTCVHFQAQLAVLGHTVLASAVVPRASQSIFMPLSPRLPGIATLSALIAKAGRLGSPEDAPLLNLKTRRSIPLLACPLIRAPVPPAGGQPKRSISLTAF